MPCGRHALRIFGNIDFISRKTPKILILSAKLNILKKDVDCVGYLTVVKGDPNLSEYKEDNTAGFIVAQTHDKANIDELDAYAREAAETMAVGKNEWDKME